MAVKKEENYVDYIARLFPGEATESVKTITIQVTDACNLACTYCYQINKCHHQIPYETACKFLDDILDGKYDEYGDYSNCAGIILEFIGGEPFLEIELVDKLTDYFINGMAIRDHKWLNRFRLSICSNGTLYFDERVRNYIAKNAHHLSFSISIDGNKKLHDSCRIFPDGSGSYDVAMAAVKDYLENFGASMGSKMTIAPGNVNYVAEAVESLIENGYTNINLNCVYEEGWNADYAKILYAQLKELADYIFENGLQNDIFLSIFDDNFFHPMDENDNQNWCGRTGAMLSVDWKGDLYPCIRYMESSLGTEVKPIIIGNVETGILATPEQKHCSDCLKCITRRSQSTDECWSCPIAAGCSWCSAYNYQCFGTADHRATFICIMHKARCLANAYYWNKRYRLNGENKRFKLYIPEEWALEIIDEKEWKFLNILSQP